MQIDFSPDDLRPVVAAAVEETLARIEADRMALPAGRLAFVEAEAAGLIGVPPHSLRDCRRRGEIEAVRIGSRIAYTRVALLEFLRSQRIGVCRGGQRLGCLRMWTPLENNSGISDLNWSIVLPWPMRIVALGERNDEMPITPRP